MLKSLLKASRTIKRVCVPSPLIQHCGTEVKEFSFCDFVSRSLSVKSHDEMAKPKLIVFDLDYTLWPFWVDTHVDPPFKMGSNGKVYDARNHHVAYYPDVPEILSKLYSEGYQIGIASRTGAIDDARDLIRLFTWDSFFHYRQIYPGCKITHFKKLQKLSGIAFKDMLFFDDEHRNIKDVSSLGVTCMFVPNDGVTHAALKEGFELFQKNNPMRGQSST